MFAVHSVIGAGGARTEIRFGDRLDGDLCVEVDPVAVAPRRSRLVDLPWTWLRQVHGASVVRVEHPGDQAGAEADAAVTHVPGAVLAIHTADCVPVLLAGERAGSPVVGACHAGWKGLYDGVIEATVAAMEASGAESIRAWIGPSISPAAYEFSPGDLATMALRFGPDVVAATVEGRPALDTRAAASIALRTAGVDDVENAGACTAAEEIDGRPRFFSWRARRDAGRQASLIWIDPR